MNRVMISAALAAFFISVCGPAAAQSGAGGQMSGGGAYISRDEGQRFLRRTPRLAAAAAQQNNTFLIENNRRGQLSLRPGEEVNLPLQGQNLRSVNSAAVMAGTGPAPGVSARLHKPASGSPVLNIKADSSAPIGQSVDVVLKGLNGRDVVAPVRVRIGDPRYPSQRAQPGGSSLSGQRAQLGTTPYWSARSAAASDLGSGVVSVPQFLGAGGTLIIVPE